MTNDALKKEEGASNPMWGGHYAAGPAEAFAAINPSIDYDKRLYQQDIRGSLAHCQMLEKVEILTAEESSAIQAGLKEIEQEIAAGEFTFKSELEDIHMNIEARLKEKIGDVAGKLHTARSRNDQVATDFRLFVREAYDMLIAEVQGLVSALVHKAEGHTETIMPGFTHLQSAQPVSFAHHLMAYVEMFLRDKERLEQAQARMNYSPLGAAALAGTGFPIDREMTASALEFNAPLRNSLDAVSDRDFVLDFLYNASVCAMHLSRISEELIVWMTPQFNFVNLPESFTSGSSIMPQKRNPDAAELVRGKSGRVYGHLMSVLTLMKSLPLAYNKDTQEDKEPLFDAFDTLRLCLMAMRGMIEGLEPKVDVMQKAASAGFSTATDLADWLVREAGLPFRDAHHATGALVKEAESRGCQLHEVPLDVMQSVNSAIHDGIYGVLSVEASVNSRKSFGGTSPERVKEAIAKVKEGL